MSKEQFFKLLKTPIKFPRNRLWRTVILFVLINLVLCFIFWNIFVWTVFEEAKTQREQLENKISNLQENVNVLEGKFNLLKISVIANTDWIREADVMLLPYTEEERKELFLENFSKKSEKELEEFFKRLKENIEKE